jgi:amino acid transporter
LHGLRVNPARSNPRKPDHNAPNNLALPAIMVAAVGNFAPWMMLFGALSILPLTLVFTIRSTRLSRPFWPPVLTDRFDHPFDSHGGPVLYSHAAFGPFVGFQSGWTRYASVVVAVAANTQVAVAYLAVLFTVPDDPVLKAATIIGLIIFATIVNLVGMRTSVSTLGAMTAVKILPLAALVIISLVARDPATGLSLPQSSAFESVVLLMFYA